MKKIFFVILFFSVIVNSSFAEYKFGVVAGTNIEKMIFEKRTIYKHHNPYGYSYGIYFERALGERFSLRSELSNNKSTIKFENFTTQGDHYKIFIEKDYLSIPILFKYHFWKSLNISGGLQLNWNQDINYTFEEMYTNRAIKSFSITSKVSKFDTYICIILSKDFFLFNKNLDIGIRILKGINKIEENWYLDDKAKYLQFQLLFSLQL